MPRDCSTERLRGGKLSIYSNRSWLIFDISQWVRGTFDIIHCRIMFDNNFGALHPKQPHVNTVIIFMML